MAKNDIDDDFDLDDINFEDFGDDEFGDFDSMNKPKSGREAVLGIAGAFASGMGDELLNSTTQRRIIENALPKGFAQGHDAVTAALGSADDLRHEIKSGMDELLKTTKTSVNSIIPQLESMLPEKLFKGLSDWSKPKETFGNYNGNVEEDSITSHLKDLGLAMENIQKESEIRETKQRTLSDGINLTHNNISQKQADATNDHLLSIRKLLNRVSQGQEQVGFKFHQKSLEVQYRTYFTMRKMTDAVEKTLALHESAYKDLVHNTGLPDVVKVQNNEIAGQLLKERAFSAVMSSAEATFSRVGKRIVEQAKPKIRDFFKDANSNIGDISGLLDMAASTSDMGIDPKEMASEFAGNYVMSWGSEKIGKFIKERIGDNPELERQGKAILNMLSNQDSYLASAMNSGYSDNNPIIAFIRDHLGGDSFFVDKNDITIRHGKTNSDMDEPASLRWRSVNTLEEIIPGWLQMLHNEVQMIRTGDNTLKPHYWNMSKARFETNSDTRSRLKKLMKENIKEESDLVANVLDAIDPENELSEEARTKLFKYITENRRNGHKSLNIKDIAAGNTQLGLTYDEMSEFTKLVDKTEDNWYSDRSTLAERVKDDFSSSKAFQEQKQKIDDAFASLNRSIYDNESLISDAVQNGQGDILEELGIIKYGEDGSVKTDDARRVDRITKSGTSKIRGKKPPKQLARGGYTGSGQKFEPKGVVHANEYVVRSEATEQPGAKAFLDAFNHKGMDALQGFATGGLVGQTKNYNTESNSKKGLADTLIDAIRDNNVNLPLQKLNERIDELTNASVEFYAKGGMYFGLPGYDGNWSTMKKWSSKGLSSIKKLGKGTLNWNKKLGKATWGTATKSAELAKNTLIGKAKKIQLGGIGVDKLVVDLYTKVSDKAVLTKDGFINGEYYDAVTGNVIKSIKDIKGDIKNKSGDIILSSKDILDGLYTKHGWDVSKLWSGIYGTVKKFGLGSIKATAASIKAQFNILGKIKNTATRLWHMLPDIYVKGEESPRLLSRILNSGKYFKKRDGSVINKLDDIDGEIVDADNNVILTMDDIRKGLVDKNGSPIAGRITRLLNSGKKVASGIGKVLKGAYQFGKSAITGAVDSTTAMLGGIRDLVFGNNTLITGKGGNVLFQIRDILDNRLPGNKLFGDSDGDGDRDNGVKDIMERRRKEKEAKSNKSVDDKTTDKKKSNWGLLTMLGGLVSTVGGIYSFIKEGMGSVVDWLKRIAMARTAAGAAGALGDLADGADGKTKGKSTRGRVGGLLSRTGRAISKVGTPGKLIGGAALLGGGYLALKDDKYVPGSNGTLGGVDVPGATVTNPNAPNYVAPTEEPSTLSKLTSGITADNTAEFAKDAAIGTGITAAAIGGISGLATGTGALAGIGAAVAAPVTLGIVAVGAATYAGIKLYKAMTKTDGHLSKFRIAQYGFDPENSDQVGKLLQLEQLMLKQTSIDTNGMVKIKNGVKAKEVLEIFNISSDEEIISINNWLVYRFRPIYDLWVKTYVSITNGNKDFNLADTKLTRDEKMLIMKSVHAPTSQVYNVDTSPFPAPVNVLYVGNDVDNVYRSTIVNIKEGRAGRTPTVGQRISEGLNNTFNNISNAASTAWNKTKDMLSTGWDTAKGVAGTIGKGITSIASSGVESVKSAYNKVGNFIDRTAESGANAIKSGASAVGGAISSGWDFLSNAAKGAGRAIANGASATSMPYEGSSGGMTDTVGIFNGTDGSVSDVPQVKGKGWGNVKDTIISAAKLVGVDPALMAGVAAVESGFNPGAKASTSSASGLFQFINSTWSAMIKKYGSKYGIPNNASPMDGRINSILGAAYIKENAQIVKGIKGGVNPADVYMAHFMGGGGVRKFLTAMRSNPNASAAALFPDAAKANKSIFYNNGTARTLQEVYNLMQQKLSTRASQFGVDLANLKSSASTTPSTNTGTTETKKDGASKTAPAVAKTASGVPMSIAKPGSVAAPATGNEQAQKDANAIMGAAKANVGTSNSATSDANAASGNTSATQPEKLKRLLATATSDLVEAGKKACRIQPGVNVTNMNKDLMTLFYAMVGQWVNSGGGKTVVVNSGWRSTEKQKILYDNYVRTKKPPMAAKPGRSKHEFGLALDINSANANALANTGLLAKWGFFRPLLNHKSFPEPWHIEHAYFTKAAGGNTAKEVVNAGSAPVPAPQPAKRIERNIKGGSVTGIIDPSDGSIKPIGNIVAGDTTVKNTKVVDPTTDAQKADSTSSKAIGNASAAPKAITANDVQPTSTSTIAKSGNINPAIITPQISPQQVEADKKKLDGINQPPPQMSSTQRAELQQAQTASALNIGSYYEKSLNIQTSIDKTLKDVLVEIRGVNKGTSNVAKGLLAQAEATLSTKSNVNNSASNGASSTGIPNNTRDPISLKA